MFQTCYTGKIFRVQGLYEQEKERATEEMRIAPLTTINMASPMQNSASRAAHSAFATLPSTLTCDTISFMGKGDKYIPEYYKSPKTAATCNVEDLSEKAKATNKALRKCVELDHQHSSGKISEKELIEKLQDNNAAPKLSALQSEAIQADFGSKAYVETSVYLFTSLVEALNKVKNPKLHTSLMKDLGEIKYDFAGEDLFRDAINFYTGKEYAIENFLLGSFLENYYPST